MVFIIALIIGAYVAVFWWEIRDPEACLFCGGVGDECKCKVTVKK